MFSSPHVRATCGFEVTSKPESKPRRNQVETTGHQVETTGHQLETSGNKWTPTQNQLETNPKPTRNQPETLPPRRSGWVDWRVSAARAILVRDLEPGGLLHNMDVVPAAHLFKFYKNLPEFADVPFDQFKERLKDHRKQSNDAKALVERDHKAQQVDRRVHPRKDRNCRGELVFDIHPAKYLLRMDVANGVHLKLKPMALRKTRPAYMEFKPEIFKFRIYQEVRRVRYFNYLRLKEEEAKQKANLPSISPMDELMRRRELAKCILAYK